jgi:hypothetical protein
MRVYYLNLAQAVACGALYCFFHKNITFSKGLWPIALATDRLKSKLPRLRQPACNFIWICHQWQFLRHRIRRALKLFPR